MIKKTKPAVYTPRSPHVVSIGETEAGGALEIVSEGRTITIDAAFVHDLACQMAARFGNGGSGLPFKFNTQTGEVTEL